MGDTFRLSLWGGPADAPCLLETFQHRVADQPETIAVVDEQQEVTYAQLLAWVRSIADVLAEAGIRGGDTVAVTGSRSVPMVAALLATMWVGAAYLPLDSEYPAKRLAHMLADSDPALLLYIGDEPAFDSPVPVLPVPGPGGSGSSAATGCRADSPAYIIYTSGSTGWPKGVAVPHSCVDNMVQWQWNHSVRRDLRTAQFAPVNFDVCFQEILGTLCGGGTLCITPERLRRDPFELIDWLDAQRIARLFLPTVALQMLAVAASTEESLDRLALVEINAAGEQLLLTPGVRELFDRLPGCRLNNHYGQSESAMVTAYTLPESTGEWPSLPPIGVPLPGCELLVAPLDPADPEVGELLVAGAPLSLGYLNQPTLNAERFITIEPTAQGHTKAFRTNDLVRVADGVVYMLSRLDHDVKIRGYRVNLLEVEVQLLAHPEIASAVCVAVENAGGTRSLHAAVTVRESAGPLDEKAVLAWLRSTLPEPFVPVSIVEQPSLPRTPSGKVDRDGIAALFSGPTAR